VRNAQLIFNQLGVFF